MEGIGNSTDYLINFFVNTATLEQGSRLMTVFQERLRKVTSVAGKDIRVTGLQTISKVGEKTTRVLVNLENQALKTKSVLSGTISAPRVARDPKMAAMGTAGYRETATGRLVSPKTLAADPALTQHKVKIDKLALAHGDAAKGADKHGKSLAGLAGRAAMTIPIWMGLRMVFMSVMSAVNDTVKTYLELETEMGRVATVTRGSKEDLKALKEEVISYSASASRGFKEAASVIYALGSAGLTVSEQMAGMKYIMDLTIGSFGNAEQIAKLAAGAYNVFGDSLKGAYTDAAKFQKIADLLAYTYSCYTPDTEVLTDQGWKLFTELDKTENMATLDMDTFELIYQKPYCYVDQKFEGNLHHIKGKFVDIMVTPNHKLFASMGYKPVHEKFELIEAKDAWGRCKQFYRGSNWLGKNEKYFYLPKVDVNTNSKNIDKIKMDDWLEFLAWYLSEGNCFINGKGTYRVTIHQSKFKEKVEACLNKLPWKYNFDDPSKRGKDKCPTYNIYNKQLALYLQQFGKAHDKYIPENVKQLSKRLLRIFLKFYAYGDGSIPKKDNWTFGIGTSSVKMRNDLHEIALKADYGSTYSKGRKGGYKNSGIGWSLSFSERNKFKLKSVKNKNNNLKTSNEELIPYKGNVVCVEIPNHILFVRRNGKSVWCGNTQQVELSEIANAMTYVASIGSLINIKFEDLVTTIGVLNSGMLKGSKSGCYDKQTEVLTKDGWKYFKDTNIDKDIFATLNPNTDELEYQKASRKVEEDYDGLMYEVKNKHLDLLVTPDHWMYTADKRKGEYKREHARDIFGKLKYYKRGCKWQGESPEYFILPELYRNCGKNRGYELAQEKKINITDWVQFMGWFISEGWVNIKTCKKRGYNSYVISISQTKTNKYWNELNELLERLPFNFKYREKNSTFKCSDQQLFIFLKDFEHKEAGTKFIPDYIKELSPNLLKIFLDSYRKGDGGKKSKTGGFNIVTSSKKIRDSLQEIALRAGYGSQCMLAKEKGSYVVFDKTKPPTCKRNYDTWCISIRERTTFSFSGERTTEKYSKYNGKIYCVEVPNHIILVRRNGKTVWCGQTALMNAFVKLAVSGDKLADLGVIFDPSLPLDFYNVMQQLSIIYGDQALSLNNLREIMDVFGRRGGRAAAQLITDFERWKEAINNTEATFEGFAEKMKTAAEDSLPKAWEKFWNSMKAKSMDLLEHLNIKPILDAANQASEAAKVLKDMPYIVPQKMITTRSYGAAFGAEVVVKPEYEKDVIELRKSWEILETIEKKIEKEEKLNDVLNKQFVLSDMLNVMAGQLVEKTIEEEAVREVIAHELSLIPKYEKLTNEELKKRIDMLMDIVNVEVKIKDLKASPDKALKLKLKDLAEERKFSNMRIAGFKEEIVLQSEISNLVSKINEKIEARNISEKARLGDKATHVDILQMSEINNAERLLEIGSAEKNAKKDVLELVKKLTSLDKERIKLATEYGEKLKSSFQDAVSGFLMGEGTFGDIFKNMSATWKEGMSEAFSEGITESLFNITGIDDMFGGMASSIKYAGQGMAGQLKSGYDYHARLLKQVFQEDATRRGSGGGVYAGGGTGGFALPGGGQSTMPGFGAGGFMTQPIGGGAMSTGYSGYMGSGKASYPGGYAPKGYKDPTTRGGATYGQLLGVAGSTAMATEAGGGLGTAGGVMGGLGRIGMGIGMMQAGATGGMFASGGMLGASFLGPLGIALAVGGMIMSAMQTPPSYRREETKESTKSITSKIDISNKELSFVNRNLVELKSSLVYIMQQSYYFQERDESSNFAIGSARGGS